MRIGQNAGVTQVFKIFIKSMIRATEEMVGYKVCGRGKKRTAWWTSNIKEEVKEKKGGYKMLQRNVMCSFQFYHLTFSN